VAAKVDRLLNWAHSAKIETNLDDFFSPEERAGTGPSLRS
jgi:hypothetical protein